MTSGQIIAIVVVLIVAAAVFVVLIRVDAARQRRGAAEAAARGETVKRTPPLGLVYFGIGVAFVLVGIVTLLNGR